MTESELDENFQEFNCIVDGLQGLSTMQLMGKAGEVSKAIKLQRDLTEALYCEYKTMTERLDQWQKKNLSEN